MRARAEVILGQAHAPMVQRTTDTTSHLQDDVTREVDADRDGAQRHRAPPHFFLAQLLRAQANLGSRPLPCLPCHHPVIVVGRELEELLWRLLFGPACRQPDLSKIDTSTTLFAPMQPPILRSDVPIACCCCTGCQGVIGLLEGLHAVARASSPLRHAC